MKNKELRDLAKVWQEATGVALTMVMLPVIFLLLGVFLDKTFSTTPAFIIITIIIGVPVGVWRAYKIGKKIK